VRAEGRAQGDGDAFPKLDAGAAGAGTDADGACVGALPVPNEPRAGVRGRRWTTIEWPRKGAVTGTVRRRG
jgi:hypothetical protein